LFLVAVWSPFVIMLVTVWMTSHRKEAHGRFAALMLCSIRGNNFYTGITIISLAMGKRGVEAGTMILAFTLVAMQLLSIGGAQLALFGTFSRKTVRSTCLQLLKNPLFLSCMLGLFLLFAGLNHPPSWIKSTLAVLSDVSTGLALIMLGAGICLQNIFKTVASVWRIVLFKLAVFPAVTYVIYTCLGLSPDMVQAGVLLAGMPIAVNTAILSQEMGMDGAYCAMGITVTTLLSLITLPVLIMLLGLA
jgi:predicted permease